MSAVDDDYTQTTLGRAAVRGSVGSRLARAVVIRGTLYSTTTSPTTTTVTTNIRMHDSCFQVHTRDEKKYVAGSEHSADVNR